MKRMIDCWAHARRKFAKALDEDRKHTSETMVYTYTLFRSLSHYVLNSR